MVSRGFVGRPWGLGSFSVPCCPPPPPQAMNTLRQLQGTQEFKKAMQEAYPMLLLALLTQMHYVLELDLPRGPWPGQEAQEAAAPSPQG